MRMGNKLLRISNWIFIVIMCYILISCFVLDHRVDIWYYYFLKISNYIWLILGMVLILIAFWIDKKFYAGRMKSYRSKKISIEKIFLIASVILLILQCFIVKRIFFYVGWDPEILRNLTKNLLYGVPLQNTDLYAYIQVNPNNRWMFAIYVLLYKLGDIISIDGYKLLVGVGILLANFSVGLTGVITYQLSQSRKYAILAYLTAAIFIGLSPWIMVPYTDIYGIMLPLLSVFFYLSFGKKEELPIWIRTILIVLPAWIGYYIKPICCFVLIAIVVVELLSAHHNINWKKVGVQVITVAGIIVCTIFVNKGVDKLIAYEPDKSVEKPMTHYAMMAVNTERFGYYNSGDDEFTSSITGYHEKEEANITVIKERLHTMGLVGYIKHLTKKTLLNYNVGIMGWGKELGFTADDAGDIWTYNGPIGNTLKNIFYVAGEDYVTQSFGEGGHWFSYWANFDQFLWINCLCWSFLCAIVNRKKDSKGLYVLQISLIGLFLFVSLFETNARYIFVYTPFYITMELVGLKSVQEKIKCHAK